MATYTLKQADRTGIHVPLPCAFLMQEAQRMGGRAYVLDERKRIPDLPPVVVLEVPTVTNVFRDFPNECGGMPALLVVDGTLVHFEQRDRAAWLLDAVDWNRRRVFGSGRGSLDSYFDIPGVHVHLYDRRSASQPSTWGFSASAGPIQASSSSFGRGDPSGVLWWSTPMYGRRGFEQTVHAGGTIDARTGEVTIFADPPISQITHDAVTRWVREAADRAGVAEW
jgi:hypothetical protein